MELQTLKGVGEATAANLQNAGFDSVEDVASADPDAIVNAGLGRTKAENLVRRAGKRTVVIQSGEEAEAERMAKDYIPSGIDRFDAALGGGWREGHIAGLSGVSDSGKTQIVFSSLGHAVAATGDDAVYIETERERFDVERIASLSPLSVDEVKESVWRVKAYSLDRQREAYEAVADSFDSVGLVAVDSFTARFRLSEQFEGRSSLGERSTEFARHLNGIESTCERLDAPVLLTLQITGNPDRYGSDTQTYGSTLMDHTLTYRWKLSQEQGAWRKAQLGGHPSQSDEELYFLVQEDQILADTEGP